MLGDLDPKITALELSPKYGKFAIEPLERGFGQTLGSAFRRVLLAHIPGAAVTDVRIDGALHEFSTIPGVKEDVLELIMNLKELAIKVDSETVSPGEELICRINAEGETILTGNDIHCPGGVEILNPELHIAELTASDARLDIEFWVVISKGYVPTEERSDDRRGSGIIPVDALYSPVKRAGYVVEPTRLGHRTDLDRLVIEVWGNGTVLPDEAIRMAGRSLQSYLSIFTGGIESEDTGAAGHDGMGDESSRWLETPIEDVDFSVRTFNCLKKEDINTLGALIKYTETDLLNIRNFGKRSLDEVIEKLAQFELALTEPDSPEYE